MALITDEISVRILRKDKGGRPLVKILEDITYKDITVPAGTFSDFASTPWGTWNIFPPYGDYAAASFVHDYLYETKGLQGKYTRKQSDEIFREAMKDLGVPMWKRNIMYAAVRAGGGNGWGN